MKYYISNRQRKEIENGKTLRIVLPAPDLEDFDPLEWAQEMLDCSPGKIRLVEEMLLPVNPRQRGGGLSAEFG